MKQFLTTIACALPLLGFGQKTYSDSISIHRQHYKVEFITEERSPLKAADTGYLRFYAPNAKYRAVANITVTPDSPAFDMPTHSGITKKYRQYGILHFTLLGKKLELRVFQSITMMKNEKYKDHLFLPFTDETSNMQTYGGGRYLDLSLTDIKDNKIIIDFNKCYNPYCAYAGGYNCPVPPPENRLFIAIKAGELLFGKQTKH
jgi:uncharacterized protein (DUF1684 family)